MYCPFAFLIPLFLAAADPVGWGCGGQSCAWAMWRPYRPRSSATLPAPSLATSRLQEVENQGPREGTAQGAGSPEIPQGHLEAQQTCSPQCPWCQTLPSAAQDLLPGGFPITNQGPAVWSPDPDPGLDPRAGKPLLCEWLTPTIFTGIRSRPQL